MKIKDSLDLGGNLLQNFCIDNYSDIDNANRGKGRTIFYTGSDVERKDHVIVFDGTSFKALAYMEDVADNAAFKALQDDVALLKGEVDTDAIISNMKEVSAFLSGFAEDANLMSVLDGKLDKTGGTINGTTNSPLVVNTTNATEVGIPLAINSSKKAWFGYNTALGTTQGAAYMYNAVAKKYMGILDDGSAFLGGDKILTSAGGTLTGALTMSGALARIKMNGCLLEFNDANGNFGAYVGVSASKLSIYDGSTFNAILTSAGGTIISDAYSPLAIKRSVNAGVAISFENSKGYLGSIGVHDSGAVFVDSTATHTLLHSGNIAEKVTDLNSASAWRFFYNSYSATNKPTGISSSMAGITLQTNDDNKYKVQLGFDNSCNAYLRNQDNGTWSAWKTIAFTDQVLLLDGSNAIANGKSIYFYKTDSTTKVSGMMLSASNNLLIGYGMTAGGITAVYGDSVQLHYGSKGTAGLVLNSAGNVTIGSEDKAGTSAKLYVDGGVILPNGSFIYSELPDTNKTKVNLFGLNSNKMLLVGYDIRTTGATRIYGTSVEFAPNGTATKMLINSSGNVTIGSSDLAGSDRKLFVNGSASFVIGNQNNITTSDLLDLTKTFTITAASGTSNYGLHAWINTSGCVNLQSSYAGLSGNKATYPIALNPLGGNVLIGKNTDDNSGAKLQVKGYARALAFLTNGDSGIWKGNVFGGSNNTADSIVIYGDRINHRGDTYINGDLHVTGNIVADGEVAAGGASEEGGSSSGGGGGAFYVQTLTKGTNSYPITHGLGTKDVIVCIYEQNGNDGSWGMILTDVEVTGLDTISVTFGSNTTVDHRVVIMGAQA